MTTKIFMNEIKQLGTNQGFYTRLYNNLKEAPKNQVKQLASKYNNIIDFIIDIEGELC